MSNNWHRESSLPTKVSNDDYRKHISTLKSKLEIYTEGSLQWMENILRSFNIEPREWQVQNALRLFNGEEVFITAGTGSGKSTLVQAAILGRLLVMKPCRTILIQPTQALSDDQVS